jgi:WhiB family redox-sensing transcriptional regulator
MEQHDWRLKAECLDADPEVFFPEAGNNGLAAKKICARCSVSEECLDYAMTHWITEGVWGGASAVQRERLRGWDRPRSKAA